jgi:hypothetical protein
MRAVNQEADLREKQHAPEAAIQAYTEAMDQLAAVAHAELLAARGLRQFMHSDDAAR